MENSGAPHCYVKKMNIAMKNSTTLIFNMCLGESDELRISYVQSASLKPPLAPVEAV
jgi:hypothetical protein